MKKQSYLPEAKYLSVGDRATDAGLLFPTTTTSMHRCERRSHSRHVLSVPAVPIISPCPAKTVRTFPECPSKLPLIFCVRTSVTCTFPSPGTNTVQCFIKSKSLIIVGSMLRCSMKLILHYFKWNSKNWGFPALSSLSYFAAILLHWKSNQVSNYVSAALLKR